MHSADYAVERCPSVRLSVRQSVIRRYSAHLLLSANLGYTNGIIIIIIILSKRLNIGSYHQTFFTVG